MQFKLARIGALRTVANWHFNMATIEPVQPLVRPPSSPSVMPCLPHPIPSPPSSPPSAPQEFRNKVRAALHKAGVHSPFSRDALEDAGSRHGAGPFAVIGSNTMDLEVGRSGQARILMFDLIRSNLAPSLLAFFCMFC